MGFFPILLCECWVLELGERGGPNPWSDFIENRPSIHSLREHSGTGSQKNPQSPIPYPLSPNSLSNYPHPIQPLVSADELGEVDAGGPGLSIDLKLAFCGDRPSVRSVYFLSVDIKNDKLSLR